MSNKKNDDKPVVQKKDSDCTVEVTAEAVDAIAEQIQKIPPHTWIFTGLTVLAGGMVCAVFTSIASGLTMLLTIAGLIITGIGLYSMFDDKTSENVQFLLDKLRSLRK